jgi:hypothetical protein
MFIFYSLNNHSFCSNICCSLNFFSPSSWIFSNLNIYYLFKLYLFSKIKITFYTFSSVTVLRGISFGLQTIAAGESSSKRKPIFGKTSVNVLSFDILV